MNIKKIINSVLIGIGIGTLIALFFSALNNADTFYISNPKFLEKFDNKLLASTVTISLYALLGLLSYLSSKIFEIKSFSLIKKTIIHYMVLLICIFIIGYIFSWHTLKDSLKFLIIYTIIYIFIWTINYILIKIEIKKINNKLK